MQNCNVKDNGELDVKFYAKDFNPLYYTRATRFRGFVCLSVFAFMCIFILFL